MRDRPRDDLDAGLGVPTPARGRLRGRTGRRPVVSHHPGASRTASHRLTRRADRAVTVTAGLLFSARQQ